MSAQIIPLPTLCDLDRRTQEAWEQVHKLDRMMVDIKRIWDKVERDHAAAVRHAQALTREWGERHA